MPEQTDIEARRSEIDRELNEPVRMDDYDAMERAVMRVAMGQARHRHTSNREVDDDGYGNRTERVQDSSTDVPDVGLLLRLMENRIGGPQDWC